MAEAAAKNPEALAFSLAYAAMCLMGLAWCVSTLWSSWRSKRKEQK